MAWLSQIKKGKSVVEKNRIETCKTGKLNLIIKIGMFRIIQTLDNLSSDITSFLPK